MDRLRKRYTNRVNASNTYVYLKNQCSKYFRLCIRPIRKKRPYMRLEKIINTAYSFGAAVVVFGAWAKIEHKDYADDALTTGLMVETGIFLLYGILEWRPGAKTRDGEQVHPPFQQTAPSPQQQIAASQPTGGMAHMEELTDTMKQTNRILTRVFRAD